MVAPVSMVKIHIAARVNPGTLVKRVKSGRTSARHQPHVLMEPSADLVTWMISTVLVALVGLANGVIFDQVSYRLVN